MISKTLEANSIPIPPHLAGLLKQILGRSGNGFDEAAFLQQLHYWTTNTQTKGYLVDGVKWIYNSLKAWLSQFCWMSEYGLRKAIANLKKLGLIQTTQHLVDQYQRVMFYRIDYDKLKTFTDGTCDLFAHRYVNSDHLDVRSVHTSNTETSSDTSFRQQTGVVVSVNEEMQNGVREEEGDRSLLIEDKEAAIDGGENFSPPSSGKDSKIQEANFPELFREVAQVLEQAPDEKLPGNLRRAIAQYPGRVKGAIDYLKQQQQKRRIKNPAGYLYEAIVQEWNVSVVRESIVPEGFSEWFESMKKQGLVLAAMTIEGVHHTWHCQLGWVPTEQLMQNADGAIELMINEMPA
jgi:hypothetical protein